MPTLEPHLMFLARPGRLLALSLVGTTMLLAGCSGSSDSATPGTTSSTLAVAPTLSTVAQLTPRAGTVLDAVAGPLSLTEQERACVAAALDKDGALLEALGDDPLASPKADALREVAARCQTSVPRSEELANALQARANGALASVQLGCFREGIASYPEPELKELREVNVIDLPVGALRDKLDELLAICGIDLELLHRSLALGTAPPTSS